jgi:hypothetical protein
MFKRAFAASALLLGMSAPAFAVGPVCGEQISALDAQIQGQQGVQAEVTDLMDEARRLCEQDQEMESQEVIKRVKERIGDTEEDTARGNKQTSG